MQAYQRIKKQFKKLAHLQYAQKILMWDEAVVMPQGAGPYRADAVATLEGLIQKRLISNKVKNCLDQASSEKQHLSTWDRANLQWMEKKYQLAACFPSTLAEKLTKAKLISEQAWRRYREQNNWQDFLPYFENTFALIKELAQRQSQILQLGPYDALLDEYAPGFTQGQIDAIFSELKQKLPTLINKIREKQAVESVKKPQGPFAVEKQKSLGLQIMKSLGFDFDHGRLDTSHHPFCNGIKEDTRITTRYSEEEFTSSLMGICHETGHALYEQGLPVAWMSQPVGMVHSMAMHESQSLLIEMQVCRSQAYFEYILPLIQASFGQQDAFTAENLFKLNTRVLPSYIRVDADEVTYPLHIILRYELEKALFKGEIEIKDLPHHWDEFMQKYLGLSTRGNDKNGVMQDVHWPSGAFGYFPAYTLGRLLAAQFFASFKQQHPQFEQEVRQGRFQTLVQWLGKHIYSLASSLPTGELVKQVTGKDLETGYFIQHIEQRYLG